jgi:hypothetical protein
VSALDILTDEKFCDPSDQADLNMVRSACAELAALRARAEDLELMLRHNLAGQRLSYSSDAKWLMAHDTAAIGNSAGKALGYSWVYRLADDGTGLPILTPEARVALKATTQ